MPPRTEKNEQFSRPSHDEHTKVRHLGHLARVEHTPAYSDHEPHIPEHITSELSRLDALISRDPRRAQRPAATQFLDIYYPAQITRDHNRYPQGVRRIDIIAQMNAYEHIFSRLFEGTPTDRLRDDLLNKMRYEIEDEAVQRGMREHTVDAVNRLYAEMMRGIRKEVEALHTLQSCNGIEARSSTMAEDLNGYDIITKVRNREFYFDIKGYKGFDTLLESGHATPIEDIAGVAVKLSSDRQKRVIVINAAKRGYGDEADHGFAFSNPRSFLEAAILGMKAESDSQKRA